MAPLVRTGGSRHTGLAAPPHRNIQRKDGNLMKKTDQDNRDKNQAERLRKTLKSFGINISEELDQALAASLDAMTIGIMTDVITAQAHSA